MAELKITELSRTSGVPSSALRYYERVGLLTSVGRSAGGYRLYDERAVERLSFIGRAKRLGLTLDEIADLVELWDDGPCAPVQSRLSDLVDDKVTGLDAQIDELARFRAQLTHVQRSLATIDASADRCGPGCGCDADLVDAVPVALGRPAEPAIACTLPVADRPERFDAWQALFAVVEKRRAAPEGIALRFPKDPATLAELARVATLEVECCSFFTFTLTIDAASAWLTVGAPADARPMVLGLFGPVDR